MCVCGGGGGGGGLRNAHRDEILKWHASASGKDSNVDRKLSGRTMDWNNYGLNSRPIFKLLANQALDRSSEQHEPTAAASRLPKATLYSLGHRTVLAVQWWIEHCKLLYN